jgi:uncharacterized membrane protein YhhN
MSAHDRFLEVKALLLLMGASAGLAGMFSDRSWLVWTGIALVAVGMILRLITRRREPPCVD